MIEIDPVNAICTIVMGLVLFVGGRKEFEKQKVHEFKLEIAKQLFQYRWQLSDLDDRKEMNGALGAVQLAFANNKPIQDSLCAIRDGEVGNQDEALKTLYEEVAKDVGLLSPYGMPVNHFVSINRIKK